MAGGHVHALYRHGDTPLHRLRPQVKIATAFLFVFAVVATPREAMWAFLIYAAIMLAAASVARLGVGFVATRMLIYVPFIIAALLIPFFAGGEKVTVLGIELSRTGLWDMWNILAKATLGLLTSVVLAGTTDIPSMLRGFEALRVPRVLTAIMGFMIRYLDVVLGEFKRMRVAMHSRGHNPRWLGHAKPYATSAGLIFIRSYERGERVYLAMASRGYDGHMPHQNGDSAPVSQWAMALAVPLAAWTIVAIAWSTL
ncbi:MAG: cobalt ECF transporter T component CbiQ [Acidimicrobiia bacterium]|nr:cobalt ECF transporter T component CbiQ [Acidimicrobiia bacterium]